MFCSNCKREILGESAKFCPDCGSPLDEKVNNIEDEVLNLDDDLKLKEAIRNFINDMSGMVNQYYVMKTAGIVKNSNLSDRNCAMTDMANLLGCSGILAKSVPMKIVVDNEIVEGVFMETVEGTDINRVKEDDIVLDASQDSFNHSKALDQLLDLQVLDYICGNIDRHGGNMIYQFEKVRMIKCT